MTPEQIDKIVLIGKKLLSAGWASRKTNDLFRKGLWLPQEAIFDYTNSSTHIIILYCAEKEKVDLILEDDTGRLNFVVCVENLLENLLSYIVLNQEEISTLNYREFITYIVKTYPQKTFLFKDNQMYRLKNKYINPPLT
ncbi:hypothetical protein NSTC745_05650 [Nostoc sp. DSM 114161]|uniref:hypothetical protein n=1 Tax=Nostoc sp. DSM 114161 TaxID=3440143 RepID=UPI0040459AC2